jgi:hypothetical protein
MSSIGVESIHQKNQQGWARGVSGRPSLYGMDFPKAVLALKIIFENRDMDFCEWL